MQLKATSVTTYAVNPGGNKCKGLPAGFGTDKLELKNVQCECPHLGACFNMKMEKVKFLDGTSKTESKKVMVQMDSASTATIGGKSLDSKFKFDCYVAALQQVMDREELEASAKEQTKAFAPLVPPATSLLLRVIAYLAGVDLLQEEKKKSLERMTRRTRTTSLLASDAEEEWPLLLRQECKLNL